MSRTRSTRLPVHRAPKAVDVAALRWPNVDEDVLHTLPPVLRGIVKALGWGRARDFLQNYGGVVIFVPADKDEALGLTKVELQRLRITLADHLGSKRLVATPKADKLFLRWRDEQFSKDMHTLSNSNLARKYKVTTRHVLNLKRLCEGLDAHPTQPGQMTMDF